MSLLTKGIRRLSQLEIDIDKEWQGKGITNLKAIAQAMGHGDIVFRGASVMDKLTADAGKGYNFLRSRGPGMSPVWQDIESLVQYMTTALNRAIAFGHVLSVPSISMVAPVASSPPGRTTNPLLTMPEPEISMAIASSPGGGVTAVPLITVPEPSVSEDTMVVYEHYRVGDDAHYEIYGNNWEAQTFTPQTAHSIAKLYIRVFRTGSPGTITVGVYATSGGLPTGSALVATTFNGSDLPEVSLGVWKSITFTLTALAAGTRYAIVISAPGAGVSNYLCWRADTSSPGYTGGARCYSVDGGNSWAEDTNQDYMFEEGS